MISAKAVALHHSLLQAPEDTNLDFCPCIFLSDAAVGLFEHNDAIHARWMR